MKKVIKFKPGQFKFNPTAFKLNEKNRRRSLMLLFLLALFLVLLVAIGLTAAVISVLVYFGVFASESGDISVRHIILYMSLSTLLMGYILIFVVGRIIARQASNVIDQLGRLASGDYKARLDFGSTLNNYSAFRDISAGFEKMAEELENTEMLRTDFINNFSHEFKTPIVSIAGFAKLLKRGNLTEEQRQKYLDAIEEESMRLSYMATNVLNMTKVENQTILTDVTAFNLSEQIRSAVLLLEGKWSKKDIELDLSFDEYTVEANEELLKQVWINLIDNAVKFVPEGGTVSIGVEDKGDMLLISVSNTGSEIPPEKIDKVFNKFYKAEESRASEGNGIGLAIVKRIVELHDGEISVLSKENKTTFSVGLPKKR